jgi:hypothetical protein
MKKITSLALFLVFAATGCEKVAQRPISTPVLGGEKLVNIYYLAGRVGMEVSLVSKEKITFNDGINTVAILPKQDQVFVNNNYLAPLGKTKIVDGMLNVRR